MSAADLIWIMLLTEANIKSIESAIEELVRDKDEVFSVKMLETCHGQTLDLEFILDEEYAYLIQNIRKLHEQCKQSQWGQGKELRFAIYTLREEL